MFQCAQPIINIPPIPPNHEWWKILVSTLGGLVVGTLLEPLKRVMQRSYDMSRMLNAVLTDCRVIEVAARRDFDAKHPHLETPGFDFYWASHRELFYETLELQTLVGLMTVFKKLNELATVKDMDVKELAARIKDNVNEIRTLNLEPSVLKRIWLRINPKARMRRGIRTSEWLKGKSTLQEFGPRDEQ